jgi:hypothetical protein
MKLFKRKLNKPEIKAINNKIAYPDAIVFCPRCGKKLEYFPVGNGAEIRCPSFKCIMGDSWGIYKFQ